MNYIELISTVASLPHMQTPVLGCRYLTDFKDVYQEPLPNERLLSLPSLVQILANGTQLQRMCVCGEDQRHHH